MVWLRFVSLFGLLLIAAGCAMPASGPSAAQVNDETGVRLSDYTIINIDQNVVRAMAQYRRPSLARAFSGTPNQPANKVAIGDVIAVGIWEASSGGLFSQGDSSGVGGGVNSQLPPQPVDQNGRITVPYVGPIKVAGLSTREIEKTIQKQLSNKALDPQVLVGVTEHRGSSVTVSGDIARPGRVPLQTGAQHLLDVVSLAGGPTAPAYETFIRLTRAGASETVLMADVVANPRENLYLTAGDSVYVTKLPQSYVVLGAALRSAEVPFGLEHLSLAQAVGRVGGLNDIRADASGVFVFRYEDPAVVALLRPDLAEHYAGSRGVPVIYRADLRAPDTLFSIQAFQIRNRDLIYIANADSTQLLKFLQLIGAGLGITRGLEGGLVQAPQFGN